MTFCLLQILLVIYLLLNITFSLKDTDKEREIEGKVVVVTGGACDIGYAIADHFLNNGAKVAILLDIKIEEGIQAEKELNSKYGENKAVFIQCDITVDLKRLSKYILRKFKHVDIFVNNAASVEENEPRKLMLINAVATIEWSIIFFKHMRKDNFRGEGGTIINISSTAAHNIDPLYATYKASKFAILGFSQSLGHKYNYNKYGVRVLTLCPGPTNTTLVNNVYNLYERKLVEKVIKYYNFATIQSSDNVGRGAVEVFRSSESGKSWDIVDEKPPVESPNTITVMPEF